MSEDVRAIDSAFEGARLPPEGETGEPKAKVRPPAETARLKFLDPSAVSKEVALRYPFEWGGREVRTVAVRRLTVAEFGAIVGERDVADLTLYDFYAAMTGLPADVLRGLIDEDGDEVSGACGPFLHPIIRAAFSVQIPESGGATQSP